MLHFVHAYVVINKSDIQYNNHHYFISYHVCLLYKMEKRKKRKYYHLLPSIPRLMQTLQRWTVETHTQGILTSVLFINHKMIWLYGFVLSCIHKHKKKLGCRLLCEIFVCLYVVRQQKTCEQTFRKCFLSLKCHIIFIICTFYLQKDLFRSYY